MRLEESGAGALSTMRPRRRGIPAWRFLSVTPEALERALDGLQAMNQKVGAMLAERRKNSYLLQFPLQLQWEVPVSD